jgi:hypothetical protein
VNINYKISFLKDNKTVVYYSRNPEQDKYYIYKNEKCISEPYDNIHHLSVLNDQETIVYVFKKEKKDYIQFGKEIIGPFDKIGWFVYK